MREDWWLGMRSCGCMAITQTKVKIGANTESKGEEALLSTESHRFRWFDWLRNRCLSGLFAKWPMAGKSAKKGTMPRIAIVANRKKARESLSEWDNKRLEVIKYSERNKTDVSRCNESERDKTAVLEKDNPFLEPFSVNNASYRLSYFRWFYFLFKLRRSHLSIIHQSPFPSLPSPHQD